MPAKKPNRRGGKHHHHAKLEVSIECKALNMQMQEENQLWHSLFYSLQRKWLGYREPKIRVNKLLTRYGASMLKKEKTIKQIIKKTLPVMLISLSKVDMNWFAKYQDRLLSDKLIDWFLPFVNAAMQRCDIGLFVQLIEICPNYIGPNYRGKFQTDYVYRCLRDNFSFLVNCPPKIFLFFGWFGINCINMCIEWVKNQKGKETSVQKKEQKMLKTVQSLLLHHQLQYQEIVFMFLGSRLVCKSVDIDAHGVFLAQHTEWLKLFEGFCECVYLSCSLQMSMSAITCLKAVATRCPKLAQKCFQHPTCHIKDLIRHEFNKDILIPMLESCLLHSCEQIDSEMIQLAIEKGQFELLSMSFCSGMNAALVVPLVEMSQLEEEEKFERCYPTTWITKPDNIFILTVILSHVKKGWKFQKWLFFGIMKEACEQAWLDYFDDEILYDNDFFQWIFSQIFKWYVDFEGKNDFFLLKLLNKFLVSERITPIEQHILSCAKHFHLNTLDVVCKHLFTRYTTDTAHKVVLAANDTSLIFAIIRLSFWFHAQDGCGLPGSRQDCHFVSYFKTWMNYVELHVDVLRCSAAYLVQECCDYKCQDGIDFLTNQMQIHKFTNQKLEKPTQYLNSSVGIVASIENNSSWCNIVFGLFQDLCSYEDNHSFMEFYQRFFQETMFHQAFAVTRIINIVLHYFLDFFQLHKSFSKKHISFADLQSLRRNPEMTNF